MYISRIQSFQDTLLGSYVAIQFQYLFLGLEICLCIWSLRAFLNSQRISSNAPGRLMPKSKDDAQASRVALLALAFAIAVLYTAHAVLITTSIWRMFALRMKARDVIDFAEKLLGGSILPMTAASSAMQAATSLIGNGILLYRCYLFYDYNLWIIALPLLLEIASLGLVIVIIIFEASYSSMVTIGIPNGQTLATTYYILTASVNILLTSFIAFKILRTAHDIKDIYKGADSEQTSGVVRDDSRRVGGLQEYSGVVSILVESCAPLAVSAVLVAVASAIGANRWRNIMDVLWYAACALSPQLIIFRVMSNGDKDANNRGSYMATAQSELVFDRPETQGLTSRDIDGLDEESDDAA